MTWSLHRIIGQRCSNSAIMAAAILWKPRMMMSRSSCPSSSSWPSASMPACLQRWQGNRLATLWIRKWWIVWLYPMKYEPAIARMENVQMMIVSVSSWMCPNCIPRLQITRANSLICERLIVATPARLPRPPSRRTTEKMPIHRQTSTTAAIKTPVATAATVGGGICMPRLTKKRVMKKSLMYLILPLNSALYGKAARATPAMRDASSKLRPTNGRVATQPTKKHQARERTSMSSTFLDEEYRTAGITNFA
mmetsp:Transcript_47340/g.135495  ORF Transcript_47340/g.135495 Transcript_47340/m.135495 type:complete len:251 (-) Transcript_47340:1434-2186(-)